MHVCGKTVEYIQPASKPSRHSKTSVAQAQDKTPFAAAAHYDRKRHAQVSSTRGKTKTRRSDSDIILPGDKCSSLSRVSTGDVRRCKPPSRESLHKKSSGSNRDRKEDSIKFLSAERKRLEKENREKKRRLEELKKQEMLIDTAAEKGGGLFVGQSFSQSV